jgi:hypothetical protein
MSTSTKPSDATSAQESPTAKSADSELKVFITSRESKCDECGEVLGEHAWITLEEGKGALCLACADLGHLAFLPSGDTALTRRSRKASSLSAVVLKWSRARKRYERQGVLVEEGALEQAESECLADADLRERRRERAADRRAEHDDAYVRAFAAKIRELFPGCPEGRETAIAEHACAIHSRRVGRTADAKALESVAINAAVSAHIRHNETRYDELLARGVGRNEARLKIRDEVQRLLDAWRLGSA